MNPTAQQAAFLTALTDTRDHLALVARAGCGKTSTILLGVNAFRQQIGGEVLVCAFNNSIAKEVKEKLQRAGHTDFRAVGAQTVHSMGWGLVRFAFRLGNDAIQGNKVRDLVDEWSAEADEKGRFDTVEFLRAYRATICELVSKAKGEAFGCGHGFPEIGSIEAWAQLAAHHDVDGLDDPEETQKVYEASQYIYRKSLARRDVLDYDDMILFPLAFRMVVKFQKDLVIVDEAQDLSRARWALIRKFVKPHGRVVAVGDDRQAIYGFAGADADSLPNIIRELGATVLPLSQTFRCPKAVVAEAQRLVPDIEAAGHYLGTVERCAPEDLDALVASLGATDAVLCRNTAPLITLAYQLIRAGKPCKVEGRAIGQGLIAMVRKWKVTTIAQFLGRLKQWEEREIQKAQAAGNDAKVEEIEDKAMTLREIAKACQEKGQQSIEAMVAFIDGLFADEPKGMTVLATYHRSKGREWPRVILWEHNTRCPSRAAKQPWQRQQEANLAYVAITRAQETLVYVDGVPAQRER